MDEADSPTEFMMRSLAGENMDDVCQVLVFKRWTTGEVGYEYHAMRDCDILGAVKYIEIAETINARASLLEAIDEEEE